MTDRPPARPAPRTPPHWSGLERLDAGEHDFDIVHVVGADALSYLQSQLSQDLDHLAIGGLMWSFVLEPTGKVAAVVRLRRPAIDHVALDTDAGHGATVVERIDRFRIRVAAEVSLEPATGVIDPDSEVARIALGWPRHGAEIEPGVTIPAETGLIGAAISFSKGCYPGQELVERMASRAAAAPVSLRRVGVDPGTSAGAALSSDDGTEVGRVTSVAGEIALALVKRGVDIGEPVEFTTPLGDDRP